MTDTEAAYIEALTHARAYHRTKLNEAMGEPPRVREVHEMAMAWLDLVIATKREHAVEDAAERARGTER